MSESAPTAADTRRLAEEARARVRFEEEALGLSDQDKRDLIAFLESLTDDEFLSDARLAAP